MHKKYVLLDTTKGGDFSATMAHFTRISLLDLVSVLRQQNSVSIKTKKAQSSL